jgi:LysM repeat protein
MLASRALAAGADIEFTGVLSGGGQTKIALRNPATGISRWLGVGEGFAGFVVTSYDAKEETVVLTKDNVPRRVRLLSDAKIQSVEVTGATAPPAIARAITNNLRQLSAARDQYFLENGVARVTLAELVGPTKYVKQINPVDGEDYSVLQLREGNDVLTVRTASGYTVTYDDRPTEHTIRPGDTVATIARQQGTTVPRIMELNNGLDPAKMQVGQKIRLR